VSFSFGCDGEYGIVERMTRKEFEELVQEGFLRLPDKFRQKIKNVGFLVEDEPSAEVRKEVGLRAGETLLGFYRGIPRTARGGEYGVGPTLPDAIIIYRKPTEEEAHFLSGSSSGTAFQVKASERRSPDASAEAFRDAVRQVVADTVWHEVAHYFGFGETEVEEREATRGHW